MLAQGAEVGGQFEGPWRWRGVQAHTWHQETLGVICRSPLRREETDRETRGQGARGGLGSQEGPGLTGAPASRKEFLLLGVGSWGSWEGGTHCQETTRRLRSPERPGGPGSPLLLGSGQEGEGPSGVLWGPGPTSSFQLCGQEPAGPHLGESWQGTGRRAAAKDEGKPCMCPVCPRKSSWGHEALG